MSQLVTDFVLGNSGLITPPASWTMALSTTPVGSGASMQRNSVWSAVIAAPNVNELASTTPAGYARQTIARSIGQVATDWQTSVFDSTFTTGGQASSADQITFTFSGAPSPNGAQSWVITQGSVINAGTLYFAADTAATRIYSTGDTEKVNATLKAG